MTKTAKKHLKARQARTACLKYHVEQASKGQSTEAFTNLKCSNIIDKSVFVEGLRNAGLDVVPLPCGKENDANQVIIGLESQDESYQIMKALHGCILEGQKMDIDIVDVGTKLRHEKGQLPKIKHIRRCINNGFHMRAFRKDLAYGNHEYAVARQKARKDIKVPKVRTKKQKAKKDLPKEEEESVAMEISDSETDEPQGLAEERHKQDAGEKRGDLGGERRQIQDTACEGDRSNSSGMIKLTHSSEPDDMLSALFASLD